MAKNQLIIGTISSLFASIVFLALLKVLDAPMLTERVPLWALVFSVGFIIFLLCIHLHHLFTTPKQVFIVLSQFSSKKFFASLVNDLINCLELHGIQTVVMSPATFLSVESEKRWFDKVLKSKSHFIGGFVITSKTEKKDLALLEFVKKFKKPLLFIDAPLHLNADEYPSNSAFIGYDNKKGGELAAKAMCHELKYIGTANPKVLVIASKLVTDRQKQFMKYLEETGGIKSKCIDGGEYLREKASKIYEHILSASNNDYLAYNGIFCTNDEMALGVHDVMNNKSGFPRDKVVLIGYDAIEEVTKLIDSGIYSFKNSVLQNTRKLSETSVHKLVCMLKKKDVKKIETLNPELYKEI